MAVYELLSGELSIAQLGERAPIQLTGNLTRNGQLFFALIISVQFFIGGIFGVLGRANMLKIWCDPQFRDRLNQSRWRMFENGFSRRLMVWLLDLPPALEPERSKH
jgi:hypothetical protein